METLTFRKMGVADIPAFVRLAAQLGYEVDAGYLGARLGDAEDRELVLVAARGPEVLGWIDCRIDRSFLVEPLCEIAGLVVDEAHRSEGIGAALLAQAEAGGASRGMRKVRLRSNVKRTRAHEFYLRAGYAEIKVSKVFEKALGEL